MPYWKPREKLNGPIYIYGRTDSGKSWKMLAITQLYHSRFNYKIFDIGGGRRNENTFWCFPSEEKKLWWDFEAQVGPLTQPGPKEYDVKLLYPCFLSKLPQKLPRQLPRIETQVFTLYFKDIEPEDISLILGDLSKSQVYLWNKIRKDCHDNATGYEILEYINNNIPKGKDTSVFRLFIEPAIENGLLAGKNATTNLDLIYEAKDKKRISILVHDYMIDKKWQMFIMNYMMTTLLFRLGTEGKIPKTNIAIVREAGDYMKKVDKDSESGEQVQIFRNKLTNIARYGRSGLILAMDTQSPSDTKGMIEGQEDFLGICEISSIDISDIIDKLRKEKRISNVLRNKLHSILQSQMIIVERKQRAVLVSPFMPPRTMAYKDKTFNALWKEKINDYVFVQDLLKNNLDREADVKEKIRLQKLQRQRTETIINKKKGIVTDIELDKLDRDDEEKLNEMDDTIII